MKEITEASALVGLLLATAVMYIKHSQCLTIFSHTLKLIKNTPLHIIHVFSILFSGFGNELKQGLSYLIYYLAMGKFRG